MTRPPIPQRWSSVAYNAVPESENPIHVDSVARSLGFRGGLVPGVVTYAYLVHPAVEAFGQQWLERGHATVVLEKPLYDGVGFRVDVALLSDTAYDGEVIDEEGTRVAHGRVGMQRSGEPAAWQSELTPSDRDAPPVAERPPATRDAMERLRDEGMGAIELRWDGTGEMQRYTRDDAGMPALLRADGDGYANPAFRLGLANWVLARNVKLGPWIHVQSEVRNHAAIGRGAPVRVEARITDLFEAKGHELVDLDVAAFVDDERLALSVKHRAIYLLRGA